MPKFAEISVQTQMERFDPGGNFPVKVVHLHRWSSLTGRSGPTETSRSISKNSRFQSYVANQYQTFGRNVNGSLGSIENFVSTEKCRSIFS